MKIFEAIRAALDTKKFQGLYINLNNVKSSDSDPNHSQIWIEKDLDEDNNIIARVYINGKEITEGIVESVVWEKGKGVSSIQTKGTNCEALDSYAVAEGYATKANWKAHAEGESTYAKGLYSHAEGCSLTIASGDGSHAEGQGTHAAADYSHTEGSCTATAKDSVTGAHAQFSHAEGYFTATNNQSEHAEGQHNISHFNTVTFGDEGNTIHSIGIGTTADTCKNAVEVMQNGDIYIIGVGGFDGTNYSSAKTLQEVLSNI